MASDTQKAPEAPKEALLQEAPKENVKKAAAPTGDVNDYELVVIVTPEATEEKLEARLNGISQYITGHGGAVVSVDKWGKRRLAYPIKKSFEGNYIVFKFSLPPKASHELENNLRISEDLLRYLMVRVGE
jgi:small subunit ribosomal protein S6